MQTQGNLYLLLQPKIGFEFFFKRHTQQKTVRVNGRKSGGSQIICSHGSATARGAAMLIRNGLDIAIQHERLGSKGRMVMLKAIINDKKYILVNIYGPNKDAEAVQFYQYLSTTLQGLGLDSDDNIIIGRDFHCPLDPTLDKKVAT